jgi:hypothetical protein
MQPIGGSRETKSELVSFVDLLLKFESKLKIARDTCSSRPGTEILLQFLGVHWSPSGHPIALTAELHSLGVAALGV